MHIIALFTHNFSTRGDIYLVTGGLMCPGRCSFRLPLKKCIQNTVIEQGSLGEFASLLSKVSKVPPDCSATAT